jgi:hypothetical protein
MEGAFYPAGTHPLDFLAYYATKCNTVEVHSTFYRAPARKTIVDHRAALSRWVDYCYLKVYTDANNHNALYSRPPSHYSWSLGNSRKRNPDAAPIRGHDFGNMVNA